MNFTKYISKHIEPALKHDLPGAWMPVVPEGCVRLSSGFPDASLVPVTELKQSVTRLLNEENDLPLHYVGSPKVDQLHTWLIKRMNERNIHIKPEELLVTSGACQAIDLIARILMDEETYIVVESPTYMEALEIFQNYTDRILTVPVDQDGLRTEELEEMLAGRTRNHQPLPKVLYTIPTFQNPTGTTLSIERRKHLLALAETYEFLIMEDDAYGELHFEAPVQTLKSMDEDGRVFYIGSLSKVVAPGMRVGWIATDEAWIETLFRFKKDLDHPFAQSVMATYLEGVDWSKHLENLQTLYQSKCNTMLEALSVQMPKTVTWTRPDGGYFVWLTIQEADTAALLEKATDTGVSYIPGKYFYLEQEDGLTNLRLSFSAADENEIVEGVRRLAVCMSQL
ncbi:PLP-dependent aminotransferase family protein [Jeotgalibacillus haloalkalitolerans]|uniref:PLP-dependent aminotransferase family protein n=1 Tax=Jeotgalibacillus haloalkalitolerans TaxID=3104292 RepID=A0ABU5KJL4_9BACL|nr:PLP-dependent aminotransferase family protein [Jeotgalibacillus sp. HH7-29]MDZ5711443.1 PLP-dependent aminotransferase family protein [Jeotgalibacillus sp. HH7-29]